MRAMQKEPSPTLDRTACNCLALRQAARHISQIYDSYLASAGLRTCPYRKPKTVGEDLRIG